MLIVVLPVVVTAASRVEPPTRSLKMVSVALPVRSKPPSTVPLKVTSVPALSVVFCARTTAPSKVWLPVVATAVPATSSWMVPALPLSVRVTSPPGIAPAVVSIEAFTRIEPEASGAAAPGSDAESRTSPPRVVTEALISTLRPAWNSMPTVSFDIDTASSTRTSRSAWIWTSARAAFRVAGSIERSSATPSPASSGSANPMGRVAVSTGGGAARTRASVGSSSQLPALPATADASTEAVPATSSAPLPDVSTRPPSPPVAPPRAEAAPRKYVEPSDQTTTSPPSPWLPASARSSMSLPTKVDFAVRVSP